MRPCTTRLSLRKCTRTPKHTRHLVSDVSNVRDRLRTLLRDTAQPVAVVTALMDPSIPSSPLPTPTHTHNPRDTPRFHGATLSSFSSIAMDPHPLVAFSLRIPSRMATSLTAAHAHSHASSSLLPTHMVINILSARQAATAVRFSRPDLHPTPFDGLAHSLTKDGLPVLDGCIGALSCRLVAASWPLHDLEALGAVGVSEGSAESDAGGEEGGQGRSGVKGGEWAGEGVASELFIAEVVRVEKTLAGDTADVLPLLYHRRGYVTTHPLEKDSKS